MSLIIHSVCMCAHTAADTNANTHTHKNTRTLTAMDSNPVICPLFSPTRKAFSILKLWVNWFMVLIIISAVLTIYCTLLLVRDTIHTPVNVFTVCRSHQLRCNDCSIAGLCAVPTCLERAFGLTLSAQGIRDILYFLECFPLHVI